jgi:hypothetical protein
MIHYSGIRTTMPTYQQLPHVIAFLLLLARLGDVGSTYLISPTLKLEANPIVRRLRWPFASVTILAAAIPYYSLPAGVAFLVVSLLVCASNCSRVWLVRTMGESEYHLLIIGIARRAPLALSLVFCLLSPLCMATIGGVLLLFYPSPKDDWAAWFAIGFIMYAMVVGLYGSLAFLRYRKEGIALNQRVDVSAS